MRPINKCSACKGTDFEIYEVDELVESHAFCNDCGWAERIRHGSVFDHPGDHTPNDDVRISRTGSYTHKADDGRLLTSDVYYRKDGRTYVVWVCSVCRNEFHL